MRKKLLVALVPAIALAAVLAAWALGAASASPARIKVIIGFDRPTGAAEEALVRGLGGSIKYTYELIPAIAAELPEEAVDALERNPNVAYVEEDLPRRVHDAELDNSWGVNRIDAEVVQPDNKGAGVTVAIIDTGIDCTHPDLDANCAGGFNFVASADFPGEPPVPFDDYGHGTHVAGTVAALDNASGVVGVAPEADLYALKVCDSTAICPTSNIIAALEWAANHNLDIANISLGSRFPSTAEQQAAQAAYDAGVLLVASAGNAGNCGGRNDTVEFPAGYDQVIAVAATNRDDLRPCFSSTGPDVELAAPGVDVRSTVPTGDCSLCTDTGYRDGTGTSMASPHVTGTAALLLAANPRWINVQVRQRLADRAEDLGAAGSDTWFGYGLVDAENAVLGSTDGDDLPTEPTLTATPTPTPEETTPTATPTAAATAEATPTATPTSGPSANSVSSIRLDLAAEGPNYQAMARVTVVDENGNTVKQAPVSGEWTLNGDFLNDSSGTTNGRGAARLQSEKASAGGGDTFTISITEPAAGVSQCSINVGTSSTTCQ